MMEFADKIKDSALGKTYLFSVGQAGFIVRSRSGQLFAIDLYLSDCVERIEGHTGFKRMLPRILDPGEVSFDVVIATHPHRDHFDEDAMPGLATDKTAVFVSAGCEEDVKRLGLNNGNITYVCPGETYTSGDFTIDFVDCDHGESAPDAVGVIVNVDGKKIYETGDTCLRLDRANEYLEKGPFDILIAPINGMYGNMNASECAELADALKPKLTVPCHYGMFASHMGSPGEFYNIMTAKYPENRFLIMAQGEGIAVE